MYDWNGRVAAEQTHLQLCVEDTPAHLEAYLELDPAPTSCRECHPRINLERRVKVDVHLVVCSYGADPNLYPNARLEL